MNQAVEVIKIEIAKMSPQEGDTIVLKLQNYENFTTSRIQSMTTHFKETYPNLKFMVMGIDDKIEILNKVVKETK